ARSGVSREAAPAPATSSTSHSATTATRKRTTRRAHRSSTRPTLTTVFYGSRGRLGVLRWRHEAPRRRLRRARRRRTAEDARAPARPHRERLPRLAVGLALARPERDRQAGARGDAEDPRHVPDGLPRRAALGAAARPRRSRLPDVHGPDDPVRAEGDVRAARDEPPDLRGGRA